MFIARMKTINKDKSVKVTTYMFETEKELTDGIGYLKRCKCPLFAAEVKQEDSTRGRIVGVWHENEKPTYWPGYTVSSGAYKDSEWVNFGTEEQCKQWAHETNSSAQCYFDTSASASHVVGTLWKTSYHRPYND